MGGGRGLSWAVRRGGVIWAASMGCYVYSKMLTVLRSGLPNRAETSVLGG